VNLRTLGTIRIAVAATLSIGTLGVLYAWRQPIPAYHPSPYEWDASGTTLHIATLNRFTATTQHGYAAEFEQSCGPALEAAGYASVDIVEGLPRDVLTRDLRTGRFHAAQVQSSAFIELLLGSDSIADVHYEPLAAYGAYNAVVVTRRNSAIYDLIDLEGRQVACVNQYSMSGYRVPVAYLRSVGITAAPLFSSGDDHTDVVRAVMLGEVGAAFTHDGFATNLPKEEVATLRVLTIPVAIPGAVWIVREDIAKDESLRTRILRAAMNLANADDDPYWSVLSPVDSEAVTEYLTFYEMLRSYGREENR
jgi:hypothetical protein